MHIPNAALPRCRTAAHWNNVMANEEYAIPRAIVLCQDNVQVNDNVTYLPIYMLMFMQHEQTEDVIYIFQPI